MSTSGLTRKVARAAAVVLLCLAALIVLWRSHDSIYRRQLVGNRLMAVQERLKSNPEDQASVRELTLALQSGYVFEQGYAVGVVRRLGRRAEFAVPIIVGLLDSPHQVVAREAALALEKMGSAAASAEKALIAAAIKWPGMDVELFAIEALGAIGEGLSDEGVAFLSARASQAGADEDLARAARTALQSARPEWNVDK